MAAPVIDRCQQTSQRRRTGIAEVSLVIAVTRLNQQPFVVNAELIKIIESTPDTMITLISGERYMVRESVEEVVERAIEYSRQIRCFNVV